MIGFHFFWQVISYKQTVSSGTYAEKKLRALGSNTRGAEDPYEDETKVAGKLKSTFQGRSQRGSKSAIL